MTRAIVSTFLLWLPSKVDQVPPPTTVNTFLFVCFVAGYVTTSPYNCLLEVPVDDILSQVYNNAQIYRHVHKHILTYIHSHHHAKIKLCLQYMRLSFGDI